MNSFNQPEQAKYFYYVLSTIVPILRKVRYVFFNDKDNLLLTKYEYVLKELELLLHDTEVLLMESGIKFNKN